jgi:predicted PhzF superfamily epimerase YddE/YHI9
MPASSTPLYLVDAFTDRPFTGNPAAVVLLDEWAETAWLQSVAMEMNQAETAFLVASDEGYDLRWFTPRVEVDLCGHATIAASLVLAERGVLVDGGSVHFATRSGVLTSRRDGSRFDLDFPALSSEPCAPPDGLVESLGVSPVAVGRSRFDYIVEVADESVVRALEPDFARLAAVECRGVVVTSRSDDQRFDFVSRFFAPRVGIDEDPVTGSAHCILAPYWGARLAKQTMVGRQLSARGGTVHVKLRGERVMLGGDAVMFMRGELARNHVSSKRAPASLEENS